MKNLIAIAMVFLLAGCAATGVEVTDEQVSKFIKGETTKEQVVADLGPPTNQTRMSDGTSIWSYVYAEYRTRPSTFIPYVGLFVGGADTRSSHVTLTFGPDGVLTDYSSTSGEMGTATGIDPASRPIQPVADQPRNVQQDRVTLH